jgi:FkbM family methyltransferase
MVTKLTLNPTWNIFELCRDKICLDIGANEGAMTRYMLENGAQKIYCFEPGKILCQKMRTTFHDNDKVIIVETGLSDEIGELKNVTWLNAWLLGNPEQIKLPVSPGACDIEGYDLVDIPLDTVDNYLKQSNEEIGFMKVDVDGYDYKVLKGAYNTITKYRPVIFIELSYYYDLVKGSSVTDFLNFVEKIEYTFISLDGYIRSVEFIKKEFPYHSSCDIFLCPNEKIDLFKEHIKV